MSNNINNLEKILKKVLPKENIKIHRLASKTNEVLLVSKKAGNNSYGFYLPEINNPNSGAPKVTITTIDNLFDFLEDNKIIMEVTKEDEEEETRYGRNR